MKANELKELLEKCDQIKTRKIISLIYKKVPKKHKIDTRDSLKHEYITKKNKISK